MFARTERLLLRPGWREDAPALFQAIADESIVRNLAQAPWPYSFADAETFLARERPHGEPGCLIFLRTEGAPRLIGGTGLAARPTATPSSATGSPGPIGGSASPPKRRAR